VWRWRDFRETRALPVPEPVDPAVAAAELRRKVVSAVSSVPVGNAAIVELRRHRARLKYRGLAVAPLWHRLDRAAVTFAGLSGRLTGIAADTVGEAPAPSDAVRPRRAGRRRGAHPAGGTGRQPSGADAAHTELMGQLSEGVEAYERLVAAAAGYIAEDGRMGAKFLDPAAARLTEAADLLRGYSTGLAELRGL
jgi:hypothetical protein